jgi:hypothetical protein
MEHLIKGAVYGLFAQILTFIQLQGNVKWDWLRRYPVPLLLVSIPIGFFFIKSIEHFVKAYDGDVWPSRLLGFGIGIIVFGLMSWLMFREPITLKTIVCLLLSVAIIVIQIIWK